jgi:hypothetical protein
VRKLDHTRLPSVTVCAGDRTSDRTFWISRKEAINTMITKLYKALAAGTVISLLLATLAVAPVSAQSQAQAQNQAQVTCASFAQSLGKTFGTGVSTAASPTNCFLSIGPGQKVWYTFHAAARATSSDSSSNNVDDSDAAVVQLAMDTPGCVAFEVWTLARLNAPPPVGPDASSKAKKEDKAVERGPVGAGSPEFAKVATPEDTSKTANKNTNSAVHDKNQDQARLIWRGGSTVPENFYIAVHNVRTDAACNYRLSVTGPIVSFRSPTAATITNPSASTYTNGTTSTSDTNKNK